MAKSTYRGLERAILVASAKMDVLNRAVMQRIEERDPLHAALCAIAYVEGVDAVAVALEALQDRDALRDYLQRKGR